MVEMVDHLRFIEGKVPSSHCVQNMLPSRAQPSASNSSLGTTPSRWPCGASQECDAPKDCFRRVFADEYGDTTVNALGDLGVSLTAEDGQRLGIRVYQGDIVGLKGEVAIERRGLGSA